MKNCIYTTLLLLLTYLQTNAQPGYIDSSFRTDFDCLINTFFLPVLVQEDGKILTGGSCLIDSLGTETSFPLVRLNENGTLNKSFQIVKGKNDQVIDLITLPDNGILAKCYIANYFGLIKLKSDCSIDPKFKMKYFDRSYGIYDIAVQNGKVLIYGDLNNKSVLTRINFDGSFDSSFGIIPMYSHVVGSNLLVLPNNNYLFFRMDTSLKWEILAFTKDGLIDGTFQLDNEIKIEYIFKMGYQRDGKVYLVGKFLLNNDTNYKYLLRLNSNGTLDKSFFTLYLDSLSSVDITSFHLQRDGNIIIGGLFKGLKSGNSSLIRLNKSGSLDRTFRIAQGFNHRVYNICRYSDNKIIVTGNFTAYNNFLTSKIARLYIDNIEEPFNLVISPNPNTGLFWIDSNESIEEVVITDLLGKVVVRNYNDLENIQVDINNEPNGIYFIKAISKNGNITTKKILKL